jgi:hypothetical protein
MLRHRRARSKQLKVILERLLKIRNGHAILIKQRRDISVIVIVEFLEDALRHVGRSAAKRVVNYNDVSNVEQEIHFRYGHQSGSGAAAAIRHREDGTRGTNPVAAFVEKHLARVHLVAKILGTQIPGVPAPVVNPCDARLTPSPTLRLPNDVGVSQIANMELIDCIRAD